MLILVALLFMLSWLPLWTLMMMTDYAGLDRDQLDLLTSYIFPFAHWLAFSNSSVNPIIYGYYNENFKRGFQAVCKSWRRMARWDRKERSVRGTRGVLPL
ncbi:Neuropeptide FF receptor 2, partial [Nibea albiflora]